MAAAQDRKEKLDISPAEFEKIQESLKNKEFRDLFMDYVNEISDPAKRELYEAELTQLESERGNNVRFVTPTPGHVLKTRFLTGPPPAPAGSTSAVERTDKVFINMCTSKEIQQAYAEHKAKGGAKGGNGKKGQSWKIPHSINKAREDFDHAGKLCTVYDCIFHPDTYTQGVKSPAFQSMLAATAIEGVEREFGVKLDRRYKTPRMSFKGRPVSTVIRTATNGAPANARSSPTTSSLAALTNIAGQTLAQTARTVQAPAAEPVSEPYGGILAKHSTKRGPTSSAASKAATADTPNLKADATQASDLQDGKGKNTDGSPTSSSCITPTYTITHRATRSDYQKYTTERVVRRHTGRPDALVVRVGLPGVTSSTQIQLSPTPTHFTLDATTPHNPPRHYKLSIAVPFPIKADSGTAVLDRGKEELVVTLSVEDAGEVVVPEEISGRGAVKVVGDGVNGNGDDRDGDKRVVRDDEETVDVADMQDEPVSSMEAHIVTSTPIVEELPDEEEATSAAPNVDVDAITPDLPIDINPDPTPGPIMNSITASPHPVVAANNIDPQSELSPAEHVACESGDESDGWVRVRTASTEDADVDAGSKSGVAIDADADRRAASKVELAVDDDDAVLVTLTNQLMYELDD